MAAMLLQRSAQRRHTSAQCFIISSSPKDAHDVAHATHTSAQVRHVSGGCME